MAPILTFLCLALPALGFCLHINPRDFNAPVFLDCYDYIIAGGGISGLVLANRLTEDENGNFDDYEDFILYPIEDGDGLGTIYDWNLFTAPQIFLDGKSRPYDMGRGIGGGSLINGMCWTRGGSADYDAWEALGNEGWGWDDLLPYMKKSEKYTDNVDADFNRELYISPNLSMHGTDGYINVSYPRYFYNQSRLFLNGLQELGIPILTDPNNGTSAGGMLIPDSISPDNQTRSDARLGYFDGFINARPNLHIATQQHVTRVLIDTPPTVRRRNYAAGLWISGVEFLTDGNLAFHSVLCSREVILAAGAVHTPQILELSGIGDSNILDIFNISVIINLPGVGNNFQDHPYMGVVYYYQNSSYVNIATINSNPNQKTHAEAEYYTNKTGPWTAGAINTVAFPSLQSISGNWNDIIADASTQNASQFLLPSLDPTVIAGYEAQKALLITLLSSPDVGSYEILNDNLGLLAVTLMHPFSRGSVHIQDKNVFTQPSIDPRYCSNPLDCQILVEGLLFNNRLINTSSMRLLDPATYSPFFQNATFETLMPAIKSGIRTGFHGVGSTSMMPLELGGVVDTHLRVYGTKNLRIVDAGIMPLVPAAHLQAPVYAMAEKAADIIKADNTGLYPHSCGLNSSFASQGPVVSNYSWTISSVAIPTASTFAQLLNSSFLECLGNLSRLSFTNSTTPSLNIVPGAAEDLLPEQSSFTGVKSDVVENAIALFLQPTSQPSRQASSSTAVLTRF